MRIPNYLRRLELVTVKVCTRRGMRLQKIKPLVKLLTILTDQTNTRDSENLKAPGKLASNSQVIVKGLRGVLTPNQLDSILS